MAALTALAQEPWCYTPEQIARLTDWQVLNVYLKPAIERAEEMRKQMPPPPTMPNGHSLTSFDAPGTSGMPSEPSVTMFDRETAIGLMTDLGLSPEQAAAAYDREAGR